jgi:hypothetical protein
MAEPAQTKKRGRLEERAERIRRGFLERPGFQELVAASEEAERAGRYVTAPEVRRKYQIED